jgi:hypothetical protein
MLAEHGQHDRPAARGRHVPDFQIGRAQDHLPHEVGGAVDAGRGVLVFVGLLLGLVDEVREGLPPVIADDHDRERSHRDLPDRDELLLAKRGRAAQELIDLRQLGHHVDRVQHGVAVGLGVGDELSAHASAATAFVDDDDRLAEVLVSHAGQWAADGVGAAAGRERHDQRDRFGRIGRNVGNLDQPESHEHAEDCQNSPAHAVASCVGTCRPA